MVGVALGVLPSCRSRVLYVILGCMHIHPRSFAAVFASWDVLFAANTSDSTTKLLLCVLPCCLASQRLPASAALHCLPVFAFAWVVLLVCSCHSMRLASCRLPSLAVDVGLLAFVLACFALRVSHGLAQHVVSVARVVFVCLFV